MFSRFYQMLIIFVVRMILATKYINEFVLAQTTTPEIPAQLTESIQKSFEVPGKGTRFVVVYFTLNNNDNKADEVESQANADVVADWIGAAWIELKDFRDPFDESTEFTVALYQVTTITTCCATDLLSLDSGIVLSNPELARERAVYEFWKSINFSGTHGCWVNEGFAVYGAYRALINQVDLTTLGYNEALDFFFAGAYQISLIEQEATAAVFWKYLEDKAENYTNFSSDEDYIAIIWRHGLTEENVFNEVEDWSHLSFEELFAKFGAACYAKSLSGSNNHGLNFPDADRLKQLGSTYPDLVPNFEYTSSDINSGIDTKVDMPSWSNFYFRLKVGDSSAESFQISVIQDVNFKVAYTLLLIRESDLLDEIRVDDETNFIRTILNDNYSEVVLVITSLSEALGFSFQVGAAIPVLTITSPLSLTAVGLAWSPDLLTVQFRLSDPGGGKEVAGLNRDNIEILVGTVIVPREDILSFQYLVGRYSMVIRVPEQDPSVSGTAVDLTVIVGPLSDTKIGVLLYERGLSTDTIIAIDRSKSMSLSGKLGATKIAARVMIDSFSRHDNVGLITFDDKAAVDVALGQLSANSREILLQAIDAISPSVGQVAFIGSALLAALKEFGDRGDSNHPHSIVLISDEESPASDADIDSFLTQWEERTLRQCNSITNAGCRPIVHTVNLGDRQVDRPDLELLSARTGGDYHFVEVPLNIQRNLNSKHKSRRRLMKTGVLLSLELTRVLRTVNEDLLPTERLFNETGSLPCSDDGDKDISVTFDIDGSVSNATVFFVWTGELLEPEAQLLRPDNSKAGQPTFSRANYYRWDISDYIETGTWSIGIPARSSFCTSTNLFLVEVAVMSNIRFESGLSYEGELSEVGEPVEIFATMVSDQFRPDPSVQANVLVPDGSALTFDLKHIDSNDAYGLSTFSRAFVPRKSGNYNVKVTLDSGSEVNVGSHRSDESSFGVPMATDTDHDGIPNAIERRHERCLKIEIDDANEDADDDGVSNIEEVANGLDPCNADSDNGGEADGSEIMARQDPNKAGDDAVVCSKDLDADNREFDRDGTGVCESAHVAVLRYSPTEGYASINVWRAEIAFEADSRNLKTQNFTLLNNIRDESFFNDVTGEFYDTDIELGKRYCYRLQGVAVNGQKSCIKGLVLPACTVPIQGSLCVFSVKLNKGSCCTFSSQVLLSVNASGAQRMKVSNSPSFDGVEWEPYVAEREWFINDGIKGRPQTVYTTLGGNDGRTSSHAASITFLEPPLSTSPSIIEATYECRLLFISGETLHFNFGLFCIDMCLPFPSLFRALGWGRGECP